MFHDILESSWSYQEIVQKGVDQGLQKGFEKGELKTLRSVLVRLVEKHFPELLPLAQQQAAQLNNLVALNATVDKLLGAKTVKQAKKILIESKTADS
jgi:flagellar biosynthesis/type III secretory pathway protein FliH